MRLLKSAHLAEQYGDPTQIDPAAIRTSSAPGIFTDAEFNANDRDGGEFRKTASVMKMVVNGFAGAGTVEMGGYDYHGGRRAEGEVKDFRAGQCMGACLEYARRGVPLMLYVMSDGSCHPTASSTIPSTAAAKENGPATTPRPPHLLPGLHPPAAT